MTDIESARQRQKKRQQYRRWSNYSLWGGIFALFAAVAVWVVYPDPTVVYAGTILYWLGFFGMLGIQYGTEIDLEDERQDEVASKAGAVTLGIAAVVGVLLTPAAVAVDATGVYDVAPEFWGIIWTFVGLFVVFGIAHTYYDHHHA